MYIPKLSQWEKINRNPPPKPLAEMVCAYGRNKPPRLHRIKQVISKLTLRPKARLPKTNRALPLLAQDD